jgi:outer membrane lipoprotein-sorting protein
MEGSSVSFRRIAVAITILALGGCAPRYAEREGTAGDAALVAERMRIYKAQITSCRRIFSFTARRGPAAARGEGIFLYADPGLYRLDVWDNMGNLLIHYVENSEDHELFVREGETVLPVSEDVSASDGESGFTIGELKMLGLGAVLPPENPLRVEWEHDDPVVRYDELDEGVQKRLRIAPESGMLSRYTVTADGSEARRASFSRVKTSGGIPRATRIDMVDNERSVHIVLDVSQESLNAAIPESLFVTSSDPGE